MADLSTELEEAVYNLAVADSDLLDEVGGRMKHGRPIAGWTFPYILYSFPNLPSTNVFQSSSPVATSISIYFDVFSENDFLASEAGPIAGYIKAVFNGASLTMDGYQNMKILLISEMATQEEETGLWHAQLGYQGMACTT